MLCPKRFNLYESNFEPNKISKYFKLISNFPKLLKVGCIQDFHLD